MSGKDSSAKEKRREVFSSVEASRSELVVSSKSTVWAFLELIRDGVRKLLPVDGRDIDSGPLKVVVLGLDLPLGDPTSYLGLTPALGDPTSYLGLTPAVLAGRGVFLELARSARSASGWGALEWPMLVDGRMSPSDWPQLRSGKIASGPGSVVAFLAADRGGAGRSVGKRLRNAREAVDPWDRFSSLGLAGRMPRLLSPNHNNFIRQSHASLVVYMLSAQMRKEQTRHRKQLHLRHMSLLCFWKRDDLSMPSAQKLSIKTVVAQPWIFLVWIGFVLRRSCTLPGRSLT